VDAYLLVNKPKGHYYRFYSNSMIHRKSFYYPICVGLCSAKEHEE